MDEVEEAYNEYFLLIRKKERKEQQVHLYFSSSAIRL